MNDHPVPTTDVLVPTVALPVHGEAVGFTVIRLIDANPYNARSAGW